ncbi:MAG: hypothetical protein NZM06_08950, partial [Chloroherpetonaceae bacterium]|nr:hypothetical protein [Chloroherpetonaceae bacterium]
MKKTISLSFSLLPVLSVFVFYAGFLFAQPKSDGVALPAGASASWWETVQKNIRESEYHIRPKGDGMFSSPNRAQNLRFTYFERGFSATR